MVGTYISALGFTTLLICNTNTWSKKHNKEQISIEIRWIGKED